MPGFTGISCPGRVLGRAKVCPCYGFDRVIFTVELKYVVAILPAGGMTFP